MTLFAYMMDGLNIQRQGETYHVFWHTLHMGTICHSRILEDQYFWEWHHQLMSRFQPTDLIKRR